MEELTTATLDVRNAYSAANAAAGPKVWPDCDVSVDLHSINSWCGPSWFKFLQQKLSNRLNLITTWAMGGEQTSTKLKYYTEILQLLDPTSGASVIPQMVMGSFGIGNDVSQSANNASDILATIDNVEKMVDDFNKANVFVLLTLPPATIGLTALKNAHGRAVRDYFYHKSRGNPLLLIADQAPDTAIPYYGWGEAGLYYDSQYIHANRIQAAIIGKRMAPLLTPLVGAADDFRVGSIFDRFRGKRQTPPVGTPGYDGAIDTFAISSQQLMTGTWEPYSNITNPPLHAKPYYSEYPYLEIPQGWANFTGTVDMGVENIIVVNGTLACSFSGNETADNPNGYSNSNAHTGFGLEQVFTLTTN